MIRLPSSSSIAWRISILFTMIVTSVFLSVAFIIHASVDTYFETQDRNDLNGKLELISNILSNWRSVEDSPRIHRLLANAMVGHHSLFVRVEDIKNGFTFTSGDAEIPINDKKWRALYLQTGRNTPIYWNAGNMSFRGLVTRVSTGQPDHGMLIYIASDTSEHEEFLTSFDYQLGFICGLALLLIAALALVATKHGLRPIREMADVAGSITAQRLQERIPTVRTPQELRPLVQAFNGMLDRLSDSLQRLTDFSADLAHELRTPISNLMMQTQVCLSKPRTADQYREILYSNLEEYEYLARMIADMLFLAKADHGLIVPNLESILLASEINAVLEFYEPLAAERGVCLKQHGNATILGDRLMVRRALGNLISNAIRYTPPGGAISLAITTLDTGCVAITVENPGPIILPDQIGRLFDRFYRGNPSRRRTDEGAGLGLAICKSIVQAHGGEVFVTSIDRITQFTLRFPCDGMKSIQPCAS